jgi:hypothetical protein
MAMDWLRGYSNQTWCCLLPQVGVVGRGQRARRGLDQPRITARVLRGLRGHVISAVCIGMLDPCYVSGYTHGP